MDSGIGHRDAALGIPQQAPGIVSRSPGTSGVSSGIHISIYRISRVSSVLS